MIPETPINWKAFEYKYSDNSQKAFEDHTYYLFCHEFYQKYPMMNPCNWV